MLPVNCHQYNASLYPNPQSKQKRILFHKFAATIYIVVSEGNALSISFWMNYYTEDTSSIIWVFRAEIYAWVILLLRAKKVPILHMLEDKHKSTK